MRHKIPRVLLIAEAANPDWVSVPLVGWNIASALSRKANVHIVTQIRNREAFLAQGLVEGQHFTAIDSESLAARIHKLAEVMRGGTGKGWTTLTAFQSITYPYFEYLVWKKFGQSIMDGEYDIVHRVTPLSPTAPSSLAGKCKSSNVPFILGPLNGGLPWPSEYRRERVKEREWLSYVRTFYTMLPAIRSTYKNATTVIAGSIHTKSELEKHKRSVVYIPENGIDPKRFSRHQKTNLGPLRLVFVGRLVPYKGAEIAIRAAANLLRKGEVHLEIVGDGPEMKTLKQLVKANGLDAEVLFSGWKTQSEVAKILCGKDMLIFPSIREFGGGVVLESMASGVVPAVVDYGGPGELVNSDCGFVIEMASRENLAVAYNRLLEDVLSQKYDLKAMSKLAIARVETLYSWDAKAQQILEVYDSALSKKLDQPKFGFLD